MTFVIVITISFYEELTLLFGYWRQINVKKFTIVTIFALSLVVKVADPRHSHWVKWFTISIAFCIFRTIIVLISILFVLDSFLAIWLFVIIVLLILVVPIIILLVTVLILLVVKFLENIFWRILLLFLITSGTLVVLLGLFLFVFFYPFWHFSLRWC